MTTFWSLWIIVITVITLIFVFATLYLNQKNYTGIEEGEEMGHEFDGIKELNNPLPKWWTKMYWATGVFAIGYLIWYPGMGNYQGIGEGWRSSNQDIRSLAESKAETAAAKAKGVVVQYDREVEKADERFGPLFKTLAQIDYVTAIPNLHNASEADKAKVSELSKLSDEEFAKQDPNLVNLFNTEKGLEIGQRLFLQNCSQCHGSDARGGEGFPNLTDDDWLYGGKFATIKQTLLEGRKAAMPAWIASLGEDGVKNMAAHVLSLSGREAKEGNAKAGAAQFAVCAACHGADGKGNFAFGAPNLTDDIWLYRGSEQGIQETLTHGRNGVMPAWKDILGEDKVHLISAYVYSLSHKQ